MKAIEAEAKMDSGIAARFGILKQRLLLQRLNEVPDSATHAQIIRQANEAAFQAWLTLYPLLTFPCLFVKKGPWQRQNKPGARLIFIGMG